MVIPEYNQARNIKNEHKETLKKAKNMTDEERDGVSLKILKTYNFQQKLGVISTLVTLKNIRKKDAESLMEYILMLSKKLFQRTEKTRYIMFCKNSIKEIKEKKKIKDKHLKVIETFEHILKEIEL